MTKGQGGVYLRLDPESDLGLPPLEVVTAEAVTIGRSSRCGLRLPGGLMAVSRVHAEFSYASGSWHVRDVSGRGTTLNGRPVGSDAAAPLCDGDRLVLGTCAFTVVVGSRTTGTTTLGSGSFSLTVSTVDLAEVDTTRVLKAALELPLRLGEVSREEDVYEVACDYAIAALAPAVASAHVVVAHPDGTEVEVLTTRTRDPRAVVPSARPQFSMRVFEQAAREPESVVFLQRTEASVTLGATADSWIHALGASLIDHDSEGRPILLYVLGDHGFATGEHWVAEFLKLVVTLTKQQVLSMRRASLSKYFSPRVVKLLMNQGGMNHAVAPRVTEATCVFFDLRGFSLSIEAAAGDLLGLHADLVGVMSIVTDEVFRSGGTVIDYQGDGVFAAWGVPFDQEDHSNLAVTGILAILARLRLSDLGVFQPSRGSGDAPLVAPCGIGIARGEVLAGTVGSQNMFKYGLLGPSVNIAQRLETLTRPSEFAAPILVTEAVARSLEGTSHRLRRMGRVQLAGISTPENVFEVIDVHAANERHWTLDHTDAWHEALDGLERARTREDLDGLESLVDSLPREHPRRGWLVRKIHHLRGSNALEHWRGIARTTKH